MPVSLRLKAAHLRPFAFHATKADSIHSCVVSTPAEKGQDMQEA